MDTTTKQLHTTLRLIAIAADPVGGHYVGMASKRPLILEKRLLGDIADVTRLSREAGARFEYDCAPVLDTLEEALNLPHMGPEKRRRFAPAYMKALASAADDAATWAGVDGGRRGAKEEKGEAEAFEGLMRRLGMDPEPLDGE